MADVVTALMTNPAIATVANLPVAAVMDLAVFVAAIGLVVSAAVDFSCRCSGGFSGGYCGARPSDFCSDGFSSHFCDRFVGK